MVTTRKPTTRRKSAPKRTVTLTLSVPSRLPSLPRLDQKRKAVIRRFAKFTFFGVLGAILAVAGFAAMQFFTDSNAPTWIVTMVGITVSGFAASVQKAINWKDAGIEAPTIPQVSPLGDVSSIAMTLTPPAPKEEVI